jgi:hypothetical protein
MPPLPKPGTKCRLAFDLMRQPGGATNKEICDVTQIYGSWAAEGRDWAERYGLRFASKAEPGANGRTLARYRLIGTLSGEDA